MTPEEARRRYAAMCGRAALTAAPILLAALATGILTIGFVPQEPPGLWLLGVGGAAALALAAGAVYVFRRQCPRCGCRSPVVRGSVGRCRRCGLRLT